MKPGVVIDANVPIVASDRLWPGIALIWPLSNLPMRGPSMITPAKAAQPPTLCTTVEPAKSYMPSFDSQPPPQTQCPTTG